MDENQKRQNMDAPSESQTNRTNNLRDAEEDSIRERHNQSEQDIQSDASGKAFYQAPEEFERDKNRNPQQGDRVSASKMADRDTKTDEYRNSKLSDTEIGGE
ncbi:hypothetical protein OCK74_05830 [Chitinophagaceae bacterium LB-8]|jgi:hypothetical protein|uniref:Uncharacterized protein n=1 Tax=Paraflavisolibacter caeni TaxID=2982496 RepID=A0A9X2XUB3_9BACT|nr:hypothetical protein [Paraflavisolibacter caeni]MCU7548626.1 hypothetical protein [Paraflavisolibacter caeni]